MRNIYYLKIITSFYPPRFKLILQAQVENLSDPDMPLATIVIPAALLVEEPVEEDEELLEGEEAAEGEEGAEGEGEEAAEGSSDTKDKA